MEKALPFSMTISTELRQRVRELANFACEFCGVTEADTAGELTVDHYQPQSEGCSGCCLKIIREKGNDRRTQPRGCKSWHFTFQGVEKAEDLVVILAGRSEIVNGSRDKTCGCGTPKAASVWK